jgi:hypothetical protein
LEHDNMSFVEWRPEHGPKTIREVIRLLSPGPDPNQLLADEVFDERGAFPAYQVQIGRLLQALEYRYRMISATNEDGGELSEPGWMIEDDSGYADHFMDAARALQCRTQRSLADLIGAGHQVIDQLAAARTAWETARQQLIGMLQRGKVRAVGRPCDVLGEPRPGNIAREIPQAVWCGAITITDDGRIVADGSESKAPQGPDPEWAYSGLHLLLADTGRDEPLLATPVGAAQPTPAVSASPPPEPPQPASRATINRAVTRVYDHADAKGMKPPNIKEISAPVRKLLARESRAATDSAIVAVAREEPYRSRRRQPGERLYGSLLPFSDDEM